MTVKEALYACERDEKGLRHAVAHTEGCDGGIIFRATLRADPTELVDYEEHRQTMGVTTIVSGNEAWGTPVRGVMIRDLWPDLDWKPLRPKNYPGQTNVDLRQKDTRKFWSEFDKDPDRG